MGRIFVLFHLVFVERGSSGYRIWQWRLLNCCRIVFAGGLCCVEIPAFV